MNRKISLGAALALALLFVALSIPLSMLYAQRSLNHVITDLPERAEEFGSLEEIRKTVEQRFFSTINRDVVNTETVRGYIAGLRDAESRYLSPEEYQSYERRLRGEEPEIGWSLRYSPEEGVASFGAVLVTHVRAGSPAAASGLQAGDVLVKVSTNHRVVFDSAKLTGKNYQELLDELREVSIAAESTTSSAIEITYQRDEVLRQPVQVMIGYAVASLSYQILEYTPDAARASPVIVGYIKMFHFYKNTADHLKEAIETLSMRDGATAFVLDLRGCSEGTVEYACKALNMLVPVTPGNDSMATVHYKASRSVRTFPSDSNSLFSYAPRGMAVLMNQFTSGAAELFAYDLHAYFPNSVYLIGTATRGVFTVQEVFPLSKVGGAALISTGVVVPVGGDADWNKEGVQPSPQDEKLVYNPKNEESQLQGAVAALATDN